MELLTSGPNYTPFVWKAEGRNSGEKRGEGRGEVYRNREKSLASVAFAKTAEDISGLRSTSLGFTNWWTSLEQIQKRIHIFIKV